MNSIPSTTSTNSTIPTNQSSESRQNPINNNSNTFQFADPSTFMQQPMALSQRNISLTSTPSAQTNSQEDTEHANFREKITNIYRENSNTNASIQQSSFSDLDTFKKIMEGQNISILMYDHNAMFINDLNQKNKMLVIVFKLLEINNSPIFKKIKKETQKLKKTPQIDAMNELSEILDLQIKFEQQEARLQSIGEHLQLLLDEYELFLASDYLKSDEFCDLIVTLQLDAIEAMEQDINSICEKNSDPNLEQLQEEGVQMNLQKHSQAIYKFSGELIKIREFKNDLQKFFVEQFTGIIKSPENFSTETLKKNFKDFQEVHGSFEKCVEALCPLSIESTANSN